MSAARSTLDRLRARQRRRAAVVPVPRALRDREVRDRVDRGRRLDAIDLLMERNRRRRDGDVEQALVTLRHDAFSELTGQSPRPDWPPACPDHFPDADGLPAVDVGELSAERLASAIQHHGALLVRGLLSDPQIELLVDDIDRGLDAQEAHLAGKPVKATTPWYVPFTPGPEYRRDLHRPFPDTGKLLAVESPRAAFDTLEVFREIGLGDLVAEHLGERPALSVKKWNLRRVPVIPDADWHQDGAFLGQGIRTVNVWITLSHCGKDAPGLDVVPRRLDHVVETGTGGAHFEWSVGPGAVDQIAGEAGVIRPVLAPGDALFFDELFLHRTGASVGMARPRYTVESWFFAPSCYPEGGDQIPFAF